VDVGGLLELDGGGGGGGLLGLVHGGVLELAGGILELLGVVELAAGVVEEAIGQLDVYEVRVLVLLSVDTIVATYV
jgi:hypothetical protein